MHSGRMSPRYKTFLLEIRLSQKTSRSCNGPAVRVKGKSSAFGYFDGANSITRKGLQLRSPTPIMASVTTDYIESC